MFSHLFASLFLFFEYLFVYLLVAFFAGIKMTFPQTIYLLYLGVCYYSLYLFIISGSMLLLPIFIYYIREYAITSYIYLLYQGVCYYSLYLFIISGSMLLLPIFIYYIREYAITPYIGLTLFLIFFIADRNSPKA